MMPSPFEARFARTSVTERAPSKLRFHNRSSQARYDPAMANFMSHMGVPIAIGAVTAVLLLGLINMMRGGSPN
jgi:hypothetical protein